MKSRLKLALLVHIISLSDIHTKGLQRLMGSISNRTTLGLTILTSVRHTTSKNNISKSTELTMQSPIITLTDIEQCITKIINSDLSYAQQKEALLKELLPLYLKHRTTPEVKSRLEKIIWGLSL